MKKAIVTILGKAGRNYNKEIVKVNYTFSNELKHFGKITKSYENMLFLINDIFDGYEKILMGTKEAKEFQSELFGEVKIKTNNLFENFEEIGEDDFNKIVKIILKTVKNYESVIIDITHGFRSQQMMTFVSSLIAYLRDSETSKIEHIIYAKQVINGYEIVDIIEYLDISKITFILNGFKDNYTISSHIKVSNKYKNLIEKLENFASDIMALSLDNLFKVSSKELIDELQKLKKDEEFEFLHELIDELISELKSNFNYEGKKRYKTYYDLATLFLERGYLLHAITLLNEVIGFCLKSSMKLANSEFKKYVEDLENKIDKALENNKDTHHYKKRLNYYDLLFDIKTIFNQHLYVKNTKEEIDFFKLKFFKEKEKKLLKDMSEHIKKIDKESYKRIKAYIKKLNILRNNLAHGNHGNAIQGVEKEIKDLFQDFNKICPV